MGSKNMNRKGFLLIEVLIGIFLLGLITTTFFPIFTLMNNQFKNVEIKNDMKYYGETVIEKIKAFDFNKSSGECILDMELEKLIDIFCENDEVEVDLPLSSDEDFRYRVNICKNNKGNNLWKIYVKVLPKNNKENMEGVSFETILQKPEK